MFVTDPDGQNVIKFEDRNGNFVNVNSTSAAGDPLDIAASADGSRVFVTRDEGTVIALDAHTLAMLGSSVGVGKSPWGLAVSPDSKRVFVASFTNANLPVFHTDTLTPLPGSPVDVGPHPTVVAASLDGEFVFVATGGPSLAVVHADTLLPIPGSPFGLAGTSTMSVAVSPNISRFFRACADARDGWFESYTLAYSPVTGS